MSTCNQFPSILSILSSRALSMCGYIYIQQYVAKSVSFGERTSKETEFSVPQSRGLLFRPIFIMHDLLQSFLNVCSHSQWWVPSINYSKPPLIYQSHLRKSTTSEESLTHHLGFFLTDVRKDPLLVLGLCSLPCRSFWTPRKPIYSSLLEWPKVLKNMIGPVKIVNDRIKCNLTN